MWASADSGADSMGPEGTCPPLLQVAGHEGTVSRRTANKKLTKLYWPSQKHLPKRLIVLSEQKKWRGTTTIFFPGTLHQIGTLPHFQIRSGRHCLQIGSNTMGEILLKQGNDSYDYGQGVVHTNICILTHRKIHRSSVRILPETAYVICKVRPALPCWLAGRYVQSVVRTFSAPRLARGRSWCKHPDLSALSPPACDSPACSTLDQALSTAQRTYANEGLLRTALYIYHKLLRDSSKNACSHLRLTHWCISFSFNVKGG